ncbi:MAG: diguanylate cyclase [Planctomycetota bacterium]
MATMESANSRYWVGCVDDDRLFLESAGRLIERAVADRSLDVPCEVELASGADDFLALSGEMTEEGALLALLVTDQVMPGCSGLELIERVRGENPHTSCVLLTGYAGLESARYAINRHLLDQYVCKPIEDVEQFSDIVAGEVERFHLRRTESMQADEIEQQAEQLRQANQRLERMKDVAEQVAYFSRELRTLDIDEVLNLIRDKVPPLFGAKSAFLFVPDRENKLALWRERRLNCRAPVPPSLDVNKVMRQALMTRKSAVTVHRDWCLGSVEDVVAVDGAAPDDLACVVIVFELTREPSPFDGDAGHMPAVLCLCGIEDREGLSREVLEYKALIVNDILRANIANALAHAETRRMANEDSLTGAKTRRAFEQLLHAEWERYERYESDFCVALMDVDGLKRVNDRFGHAAGDEVIRRVAEIADRYSRRCDTVGRYGGDEFCLLLPETDEAGARRVVDRLVTELAAVEYELLEGEQATVSAGVANSSESASPHAMLMAADAALYRTKEARRRGD